MQRFHLQSHQKTAYLLQPAIQPGAIKQKDLGKFQVMLN